MLCAASGLRQSLSWILSGKPGSTGFRFMEAAIRVA